LYLILSIFHSFGSPGDSVGNCWRRFGNKLQFVALLSDVPGTRQDKEDWSKPSLKIVE
jgi:hypothetical protein